MGNYNPHAPLILGEEWVPIRDENLFLSPAQNVVEVGHEFTLTSTQLINHGRFYVNNLPQNSPDGTAYQISVYPVGLEDQTGPVDFVDIPVNAGGITGNAILTGATVADALSSPADALGVTLSGGTPDDANVDMFFSTNQYSQLLQGKRIVSLQLIYVASSADFNNFDGRVALTADFTTNGITYAFTADGSIVAPDFGPGRPEYESLDLGEVSPFFSTTPFATTERMPWVYATLQRFEASSANRIITRFSGVDNPSTAAIFIRYVVLRVTYCEEKRAAVGGVAYAGSTSVSSFAGANAVLSYGANIVPMRTIPGFATNPALTAGRYTVVLSSPSVGRSSAKNDPYSLLNALRELYDIPTHPGRQVNVTQTIGDTFTVEQISILPQLSLHTTGGPLTEPHSYGRQVAAEVYGSRTATQEIYDDISGVAADYPQVRFFARRFGDTSTALTITGTGATVAGSSASITPSQFDTLQEIIDGWRQVDLRLSSIPSMGAVAGSPAWTWTAFGETSGNRWEILGACAPALTGIPGNLLALAASPHQLGTVTYQPPSGSTVELTWAPQGIGSPWVSGASADATSDAVLMFSQDPPVITGFAVSMLSQELVGFTECGSGPCCIPTALQYHRVTWSPTTLVTTGFGAYELQRHDTTDTDWQTIMLATSPSVTGFNDYEARVGVLSSYQIRQLNALDFAGSWSATGTGTITAPGITLPSCGTNKRGVLIFTTNEVQDGANNLAYAMVWDGEVSEDFSFVEAGSFEFSQQFARDYQVAFHGDERGGESFTRELLLANAAVSLPRLGNVRSLRDMAWDDTPYVCVRDDIGDRWLAAVIVGEDRVRRNRRLYNARITVVEVTATPSPMNP